MLAGSEPASCESYYPLLGSSLTNILQAVEFHALTYPKVVSSNTSCLETHAGCFRLLVKGIFEPYVLKKKKKMQMST